MAAVLRKALAAGWLDDLAVVQLSAKDCVKHPALCAELQAAGKKVVVNSPIRRVLGCPSEEVNAAGAAAAVHDLYAAAPTADVVLAGTGNPGRLQTLAALVTAAKAATAGNARPGAPVDPFEMV